LPGIIEKVALVSWVYLPLTLAAGVWNFFYGTPIAAGAAYFLSGLLAWTLLEYAMHRFAFHGFAPHYKHHADPVDPKYILAPLWFSLSAAATLWIGAALLAGSWSLAALLTSGVLAGYLAYEWVHLRIHSQVAGGQLLRSWRKHHYYHHFADDRKCYGVTSPLWDSVFGSLPVSAIHSPAPRSSDNTAAPSIEQAAK
jgi:sterol desaturase/sphingolipid hydroxylase (fatty acid hydroxylase superfamily)